MCMCVWTPLWARPSPLVPLSLFTKVMDTEELSLHSLRIGWVQGEMVSWGREQNGVTALRQAEAPP